MPFFFVGGITKLRGLNLNGQCHRSWHFPLSMHRWEPWVWRENLSFADFNETRFCDLPDMKVSWSTVKMWLSLPRTQDTDLLFRLNTLKNYMSWGMVGLVCVVVIWQFWQWWWRWSPHKRDKPLLLPVPWTWNQCWGWRRGRWGRGSRGCCLRSRSAWGSFPTKKAETGWLGGQTTSFGTPLNWITS